MPSLRGSVRRHLGITVPLFVLYAAAVLLASRGRLDAQIVAVLGVVLAITLLTPVAIGVMNRRLLRGSWTPELRPGEQVLRDGPADRYQFGHFGWLFLTTERLVLYRVGGIEDWAASLADVREVHAARYAGVFATDLRIELASGATETFKVEGSSEWAEKVRAALPRHGAVKRTAGLDGD
jgi:hypothetical protein